MAKTSPSLVWHKPIKYIGNGFIELIAAITDFGGGGALAGIPLAPSTTAGSLCAFASADPDFQSGITLAEDAVNLDVYALIKKKGAKILHNQVLASTYGIGDAVYKSAAGTWTHVDHGVAGTLIVDIGIVCGPADRITAGAIKTINDTFTATEPVDICI